MTLEKIIEIIENDGYKYSYNETSGDHEFGNEEETISVYDDGDTEKTIVKIKEAFSYLF